MILLEEVLAVHDILLNRFGGSKGVRDEGLLDSAINRPYQTFDGQELYPTPLDKAAAIFESIITNHPFIDGNKRTSYVLMRLLLKENNLEFVSTEDEKYDFVIKAASGKLSFKEIRAWIKARLQ